MQLIRTGIPRFMGAERMAPTVRFAIRSPTRPELGLFLDCEVAGRAEALELILRNRSGAEGPLLLDEDRLRGSEISSEWGEPLASRIVAGYDRLSYFEFERFWDKPIPPSWLEHDDKTGLSVTEVTKETRRFWFLNTGLKLARVMAGDDDRFIRNEIYDAVFGAFTRCAGDLYLVSDRPSVFSDERDAALVRAAIEPRLADWKWLVKINHTLDELTGHAPKEDEGEKGEE
ncbi:MAG TPA: hypothetical protein VL244_07500 [Alphaproteobacteria bacterium]|nr:hypothetical protein [Alphaproteobacteria bacterium]